MNEQREPTEWLETQIPKSLYRELRETVARDMGYPSVDAVYASENGDDEMFDWKVDQAVMEALRQWIAGSRSDVTRPLPEIETMYTAVLGPHIEYALPGCVIRVLPIGRGIGFWLTDRASGSDVDFLWRWSDCCYVHERVFMQRWPEMKPRYSAVPNRRLDALLKRYGREPSGNSAPSSPAEP